MIHIEYTELHNPLFLGGKNLGVKIDAAKLAGIHMEYSREDKELYITWQKKRGIIPSSNIAVMIEVEGEIKHKYENQSHPMVAGIAQAAQIEGIGGYHDPQKYVDMKNKEPIPLGGNLTAQVETPFTHVHAGLGAGKTGKSK